MLSCICCKYEEKIHLKKKKNIYIYIYIYEERIIYLELHNFFVQQNSRHPKKKKKITSNRKRLKYILDIFSPIEVQTNTDFL